MPRDVLSSQHVPVVSGRGHLTTQPNGDLLMPSAAVNLVVARHVPKLLLTISPMATHVALLRPMTVPMTQDVLAATGLGLL